MSDFRRCQSRVTTPSGFVYQCQMCDPHPDGVMSHAANVCMFDEKGEGIGTLLEWPLISCYGDPIAG